MSCGFLHHLQYTPEEIKVGRVNLLGHFAEILPTEGRMVGLITLANGMNTTYSEFKEMSRSVADRVAEGTLFIGLHTPTDGFFQDIGRSVMERENYITPVVIQSSQFMGAIIDRLHKINPELIWVDIRHSEGGVIGRRAIEMLTPLQQASLQRQLYSLTIGAAMPMPNEHALQVCNIYSDADYFTGAFGKTAQMMDYFMESSFYNIEIHSTKAPWSERVMGFADHAFAGSTYKSALDAKIEDIRNSCGFYDARYR